MNFQDMTPAEVEARRVAIEARLVEIASPTTVAQISERRELRSELADAVNVLNTVNAADIEVPAVNPAPVAPEVVAPTDAEIVEALDQLEVVANTPVLQAAAITLVEAAPTVQAATIRLASVNGDGGAQLGASVDLVTFGNRMVAAARGEGQVHVASVSMVSDQWTEGLVSGADRVADTRRIEAAQAAHREARLSLRTAAACGAGNVWNDATTCYMVDDSLLNDIAAAPAAISGFCEIVFNKPLSPASYQFQTWCDTQQATLRALLTANPADPAAILAASKQTIRLGCPTTGVAKACAFPIRVAVERCNLYTNPQHVQSNMTLIQEAAKVTKINFLLAALDAQASVHSHNTVGGYDALTELYGALAAYYAGGLGQIDRGQINGVIVLEYGFVELAAFGLMSVQGVSFESGVAMVNRVLTELGQFGQIRFVDTGTWAAFRASLGAPGAAATPYPAAPTAFKVRWYDADSWFRLAPESVPFGIIANEGHEYNEVTWFGEEYAGYGFNGCVRPLLIDGQFCFSGRKQAAVDVACAALPLFT